MSWLIPRGLMMATMICKIWALLTQPSSVTPEQCAANLACAVDYQKMFQTKLDNATAFLQLQLALLTSRTDNIVQPLQKEVEGIKANSNTAIGALNNQMRSIVQELAHDREYLGNLTRGLYILNNDFHKEQGLRYNDVTHLISELNLVKSMMAGLQNQVNTLMGLPANATVTPVTSLQTCASQNVMILELKQNLTAAEHSHQTTQQTLHNVQIIESFLQQQVVSLKANVSKLETSHHAKDLLIQTLQAELLKLRKAVPPSVLSCNNVLGVGDGTIADSAITASAVEDGSHGPSGARLNNKQGWYTPERLSSHDWVQIDLGTEHYISGVQTQGAPCCDVMVTNYTLQFSPDGANWKDYERNCQKQYLTGNSDQDSVVSHTLHEPVLTRYVRFNVVDFKKDGPFNYVGMRVELFGCNV